MTPDGARYAAATAARASAAVAATIGARIIYPFYTLRRATRSYTGHIVSRVSGV